MKEVNEMKTIKFNNKVVAVPAETIVEYLEYRKLGKELEPELEKLALELI